MVTLSIMRMTVQDAASPVPYPVLSLAAPRSLVNILVVLADVRAHLTDV